MPAEVGKDRGAERSVRTLRYESMSEEKQVSVIETPDREVKSPMMDLGGEGWLKDRCLDDRELPVVL